MAVTEPIPTRREEKSKESSQVLDEFEKLRREQETKNEIVITLLRGVLFLGGFLGYLLSRVFLWAPHPPPLLGWVVGLALIPNFMLLFYLRAHPLYSPIRKYILNAVETMYHTMTVVISIGYLPISAIYFLPI